MVSLKNIGQIALAVDEINQAEIFYEKTLGLKKLYRFGDLVFFDCGCGNIRLLIEPTQSTLVKNSIIYFSTPDLNIAYPALKEKGVVFTESPHLVAPMPDHDLWMAFFNDPAGNTLALMQEAPKGWQFNVSEVIK